MPTSMTVAPGFSQSPRTISGRPTAATTMSARRTRQEGRASGECAMVTVHFRRSSSCAIGLPTMFERPTTMASRPREVAEFLPKQHQAAERGAGDEAVEPDGEAARVHGIEAVDVLVGRNPA